MVVIPDKASFYSLYADGQLVRKTYVKDTGQTYLAYPPGSVVALYYTYPAHRAVSVIRNAPGRAAFPGLSKKVRLLFTVHASRVDKLKRVVGFLNKHAGGAFHYTDDFYTRLYFAVQQRGKISYLALRRIVENAGKKTDKEADIC